MNAEEARILTDKAREPFYYTKQKVESQIRMACSNGYSSVLIDFNTDSILSFLRDYLTGEGFKVRHRDDLPITTLEVSW